MKKMFSLWIIAFVFMNMTFVSAEMWGTITKSVPTPKHTSLESFLKAEGKVCKSATDGINLIMIEDGEATISTMAYTPNPEYSCTNYKLSDNDRGFYTTVREKISADYVERVDFAIKKYEERMKMLRWSDERRIEAHKELIQKVETMISKLLMKYPQDIALPKAANDTYMKLTLIKFELMLLDM